MPPQRRKRRFKRRRRMPIVKLIKKVIKAQAEHKHIEFDVQETSLVAVSPFTVGMNIIGTGTTVHSRIGNDINVSSVKFRYELFLLDASETFSVRVYAIQFLDDILPETLPNVGELFPTLDDAKHPYRILYDRTHQFGLGVNQNIFRTVKIKGRKLIELKYEDGAGTTPLQGNLFLTFVTNNILGSMMSVQVHGRTTFIDL